MLTTTRAFCWSS